MYRKYFYFNYIAPIISLGGARAHFHSRWKYSGFTRNGQVWQGNSLEKKGSYQKLTAMLTGSDWWGKLWTSCHQKLGRNNI